MPRSALGDLDDALDATRSLLTPVDRTVWAKPAVVVPLLAGPGGANGFQYTFGGDATDGPTPTPGGPSPPDIGPRGLRSSLPPRSG